MAAFIDISTPIHPGMAVWPGDPPVTLEPFEALADGGAANVSRLSLSVHTGTHVDAPRHYFDEGAAVDALSLNALVGPAWVRDVPSTGEIVASHLPLDGLERGARVLLRTRGGYLTPATAQALVDLGVVLVGIDGPSIGAPDVSGAETHRLLLEAGIVIVEGLRLEAVPAGRYELICLPLRLVGADGAPARAVLCEAECSRKGLTEP